MFNNKYKQANNPIRLNTCAPESPKNDDLFSKSMKIGVGPRIV